MRSSSSSTTGQASLSPSSAEADEGLSFVRIGDVVDCIAPEVRDLVERRPSSPIEKAWVDFLKVHDWRWFGTFTYKDPIHPEAADKQFRLWARRLDESNGVKFSVRADSRRRCIWVRGLEWQKRNVLHYHALIGNLPAYQDGSMNKSMAELEWLTISGGFCRIDSVYSSDVIGYVAKYTAKGGEIDFSANLTVPDLLAARRD